MGQKFRRNCSIYYGFRDISIFMFCNFCKKFKNSKWPPFLARQKYFENWDNYSADITCGSKISSKLLYLVRFSRYKHFKAFLCFAIFAKNSKIQNGRHFWQDKTFFKNGISTPQRNLRVKNFVEIALSSTVFEI